MPLLYEIRDPNWLTNHYFIVLVRSLGKLLRFQSALKEPFSSFSTFQEISNERTGIPVHGQHPKNPEYLIALSRCHGVTGWPRWDGWSPFWPPNSEDGDVFTSVRRWWNIMKYPSTSVTKKHRNHAQGKECFMKKHFPVFPGKTTFSLRQLYLRAGYVEARNGWYMKATQIEAKFDAWRGWCTLINECKGMPRGTESHKTYGWLTSESLSISHWHCRIRPFGNGRNIPTIGMNMNCCPIGNWVSHAGYGNNLFLTSTYMMNLL